MKSGFYGLSELIGRETHDGPSGANQKREINSHSHHRNNKEFMPIGATETNKIPDWSKKKINMAILKELS